MKKPQTFAQWVWLNLRKDRLTQVQIFASIANCVVACIPVHGLIPMLCQLYCVLVIFGCIHIDRRRWKKRDREIKEGMALLSWFEKECQRLMVECTAAERRWDVVEARRTAEQLQVVSWRYRQEALRIFPDIVFERGEKNIPNE